MRTSLFVPVIALTVAWPASLLAQPQPPANQREEAARSELIAQAEQATDAGDHTRALDLLSRAAVIRVTPSLRLRLSQEHNALGHTIDAYELATRCAQEALADPTARNRDQVIAQCSALANELRTRVGRVTLQVPSPPPGLRVRVSGGEVSPALWGIPYTVTPGLVVVEATAEWHQPFRQEVSIAAGQNLDVRVAMVPAARSPSGGPTTAPASGSSLVGPIALASGGVVALGLAGVFFALRNGTVADRDAQCSAAGCQPTSLDLDATARTQNTLTNVFLAVGGAAIVGAGVWFFVGRASGSRPARTAVTGSLVPVQGGAMFGVGGVL